MQRWVYEGVDAYSKRMPAQIQTQFMEIQAGTRSTRATVDAAKEKEAEKLLKKAAGADLTIALDESGKAYSSIELANEMRDWLTQMPHVAILIGGPDGLTDGCKGKVDRLWSLSR